MSRPNRLRDRLSGGGNATGLSCVLGDAQIAEEFTMAGYDYVYLDQQHGLIPAERLVPMLRALAQGAATPLVRVAGNDPTLIGQALDAGAEGVIVPMVEDADAAARAAAACRYFPDGTRSWGPIRATHGLGGDPATVNGQVMCLVMIETAAGVADVDAIVATPGVDGVYIGPADLSVSLGGAPTGIEAATDPALHDAVRAIREACARHGKVTAITGTPAKRHAEGFGMVTAGSDIGFIRASLAALAHTSGGPA